MTSPPPVIHRAIRPLACCLLALLAAGHAGAAGNAGNSVQLKVVGSLVPPACNIALPGGDTVDYGRMQFSELSSDSLTVLTERNLNFSISCDAPARVALTLQDAHPGTVVHDLVTVVRGESDAHLLANGLGAVNGVNIGAFYVRVFAGSGQNRPGTLRTVRSEGVQGWSETPVDAPLYADGSKPVGFSDGQGAAPTALSTVSGRLAIQPLIRPRGELPTSNEITLAGASTLTLYYQ